jgi:2'-5' RNA ligase
MAQSAFIVRVPEAEPRVAHWRERFDPSARLGVPAHITLLYPFMSPELISVAVVEQASAVVSATRSFTFALQQVRRFPGALYLAPEPSAPFIALTRRLTQQFPEFPPYGGQYQTVVPHLTVAHGGRLEHSDAETELLVSLSVGAGIACSCNEIVLIENASGRWQPMRSFALSSRPSLNSVPGSGASPP